MDAIENYPVLNLKLIAIETEEFCLKSKAGTK